MSIATEIARLQQAKADLKASINAKGGNITTETLDQYASAVDNLPSGNSINVLTVYLTNEGVYPYEGMFNGPIYFKDGNGDYLLNFYEKIGNPGDGSDIKVGNPYVITLAVPTETFSCYVKGGSEGRDDAIITNLTLESKVSGVETYRFTSNNASISFNAKYCYIKDTPITLADRTYKLVQDITYQDDLLVWDFDKAEFASAKPIWIQKQKQATEYNHLVFSDGSELNTVNQHRVFNVEKGMFTYPMTDDTPIGTTTFNDKGEYVTLVSKEVITKEVEYYNIITDYHMNLFAGTILTSCRLSNLYPIDNMMYQKDDRELHDASLFYELEDKWVKGLRLLEQPLDINRDGAVVFENSLIEYVKRLERDMK